MTAVISLPAQLDGTTAASLRATLLAARGQAIRLSGDAVTRFGAQGLQVLLSAGRTWREDGMAFELADASPALVQGLAQLGAGQMSNNESGATFA